jgi:flagellar biosynthetic protein FlhB
MAESESGGDRSEAATPRRLQQLRDSGRSALSREAAPVAVLAVSAMLLTMAAPAAGKLLIARLSVFLVAPAATSPTAALRTAMLDMLWFSGPYLLACVLAGAVAVMAQTGGMVSLTALMPDLGRLDPRRGLARLAPGAALLEAARSLAKLGAVGAVSFKVVAAAVPLLPAALMWEPTRLLDATAREVLRLTLILIGAQVAIAGFDIIRARMSFASSTRMTRQEIKDEHKETEGDPQIKNRIRKLRQQRARRRMMKAVPKAAVVVTNPTHYAVALAYERGSGGAPRVVAKGVDSLALRIRDVAREHNVPVVENPPLARALHALDLDSEIPRELYQTVAEVIAYVWRLRKRARL